jgi:trimethylamine--corrinoid protein Co-methyltransferase
MVNKGFTRRFKPIEILTDEQIEEIHRGTLDVLERTGIRFESEKALTFLADHGCKVDFKNNRVRIPSSIVEESLSKCPTSFELNSRDPKNNLRIGGNTVYFTASVGMRTVDLENWNQRVPTQKENDDAVKVLDALDSVHLLVSYCPYSEIEGVHPVMAYPTSTASRMRFSTKTSRTSQVMDSEIWDIKMAEVTGTDVLGDMEASPPLTFYENTVNSAFRFGKTDFPVFIASGPVMGGTAPVTFAGSTITNNAEIIAGIVLLQLISPGKGVIASHFVFPINMRTGQPGFGSVEITLHDAMFNQIWRKYGIPTASCNPYASNAKTIGFQNGYERMLLSLIAALSGANFIILHGGIHGELTFHPVQAVLDDDIAGIIGRFIEGVDVSDDSLAIDLIEKVGPIPGAYLDKEHTRKWWKKEFFLPQVADRYPYSQWIKEGAKTAVDNAKLKVEEIIANYEPMPLSKEQDKEIDEILKEAKAYYTQKGVM